MMVLLLVMLLCVVVGISFLDFCLGVLVVFLVVWLLVYLVCMLV